MAFGGMSAYFWIRVRTTLADLYREAGREADARVVETELLQLLALADPDHPILTKIQRVAEIMR